MQPQQFAVHRSRVSEEKERKRGRHDEGGRESASWSVVPGQEEEDGENHEEWDERLESSRQYHRLEGRQLAGAAGLRLALASHLPRPHDESSRSESRRSEYGDLSKRVPRTEVHENRVHYVRAPREARAALDEVLRQRVA